MRMVHTQTQSQRVTVTLPPELFDALEAWVADEGASRSEFVQEAIRRRIRALRQERLAREAAKLDPAAEREGADEGSAAADESWPEY